MQRLIPLLLLFLIGCTKNEVTLTFSLPEDFNRPCRIMYYASDDRVGMYRETAAEIIKGKGEIKLPQRHPSLIYLFAPAGNYPSAVLYAGRGEKIDIAGEKEDILTWEITGNATNELLSKWRIQNAAVIAGGDREKINAAVARFIKENPDSQAAAILLYVYFNRRDNEAEFEKLRATIGKKVLDDDKLMRALSSADFLTGLPDSYTVPKSIILHGEEGYADTLALGHGKSTLLIFRNNNSSSFLNTDSLARLISRAKDLAAVELFAEPDSTAWRRHLKNDTVPGLQRLWFPFGTADSIAIRMGVRRIPYYVIIDSRGKEIYRGEEWKEVSNHLSN